MKSDHRDRTILARIFAAAGVELVRDADNVARVRPVLPCDNRRGTRLQRAIQLQAAAGNLVVEQR